MNNIVFAPALYARVHIRLQLLNGTHLLYSAIKEHGCCGCEYAEQLFVWKPAL